MSVAPVSGWAGIAFAYASVQVPMIVALARSHGRPSQYFASPAVAVPLTVAAAVGMALASPALQGLGFASDGAMHWLLGTALSVGLGYTGGRVLTETQDAPVQYQRGAVVLDAAPAARAARGRPAGQIRLAGLAVPARDEAKHFKLIGTTGTGKSTAIREILQGALARGDRAVIADPDGGYSREFHDPGRGDVILNPFDQRSVKWDLFGDIETGYDVEQLAHSLIPDHEGADRSWRGYARTFFSAVAGQAHEAGVTDVGELFRLLVVAPTAELRELLAGTPAQPFLDEHNARMFDSIRSVTASAVGALKYVAPQTSAPLSVRQWVRREDSGVLFIPYKAGQIAALRSTISAWMRIAIFETMDRSEPPADAPAPANRRLWFVVDELDALGQIDGLKDALARLRKFDGRCVLGFQSIAQVSSTYGEGEAHTIVENCGNTLILRCSASEGGGTARFASQLIGEREVVRTTVSTSRRASEMLGSRTHSERFDVESALLPSQIEQLPDLAGYLKYASDPHWRRVTLSPAPAAAREVVALPAPAPTSAPADAAARRRAGWGLE